MSDWLALLQPWALSLLGAPWVAAVLVGIVPSARYRRTARQAQEMAAAMPPGPLREAWQTEANRAGILLLTRVRGRRRTRRLTWVVYGLMPLTLSAVIAVWIVDGRRDPWAVIWPTLFGLLVLGSMWLTEGETLRRAARTNRRERALLLEFHGVTDDNEMVYRELWMRQGLPTPEEVAEQNEQRAVRRQERRQRRQTARAERRARPKTKRARRGGATNEGA